LNHGLSALDVHEDGFTPFHRACWGNEQRHTDTVEVFLKAGVPVDTRAADGKTCRKMTQNRATKKLLKRYEDKAAKEL
jgi:ankyrin repeat protein